MMKDLLIPDEISAILKKLTDSSYEAYLVGGCVRDFLLGKEVKDFDISTNAKPEEVKAVFSGYRVIETGIDHGTLTVIIDRIPAEVTTFRSDGEYFDHRRPSEVIFTDCVTEDLSRRDFTINAMALNRDGGILDPFGGRDDLREGIIRCVGDPRRRFAEDSLRIMRGMRFACVTGFSIEGNTAGSMKKHKDLLNAVSAERIGKEFMEMICGDKVEGILTEFRDIIGTIIPELKASFDFDQRNPHHCYDIYTHSVKTAAALPADPLLRMAGQIGRAHV